MLATTATPTPPQSTGRCPRTTLQVDALRPQRSAQGQIVFDRLRLAHFPIPTQLLRRAGRCRTQKGRPAHDEQDHGRGRSLSWGKTIIVLGKVDRCLGARRSLSWGKTIVVLGQDDRCLGARRSLSWERSIVVLGHDDRCLGRGRSLSWGRSIVVLGQVDHCLGRGRSLSRERSIVVLGQDDRRSASCLHPGMSPRTVSSTASFLLFSSVLFMVNLQVGFCGDERPPKLLLTQEVELHAVAFSPGRCPTTPAQCLGPQRQTFNSGDG